MKLIQQTLRMFSAIVVLLSIGAAQQESRSAENMVPRVVSFSGHASDANGKAISGVAGVTFAIYREQQGGAPLWLETQSVNADTKGNFTAQLGATKPEGLPLDAFASGEARWLGVSVNGGAEQPRVLLMSVPYALKAADAQTLGGLPASAFVLAAPIASSVPVAVNQKGTKPEASAPPPASSNVTTTGGTVNAIPLFTTATNVQNSILTQTGTTAVNVAGKLNLPSTGAATATAGKNSRPESFVTSVFNSTTGTAVPQSFQLQAEPANNNTNTASGTLNLLYASGTNTPAETGLKIAGNGQITFAAGQKFPGTGAGTITGVTTASGSGLVGGGASGTLKMSLLTACTTNQILKWNGTAWACAADANSGGTVQSVALTAPVSDFTVTGSPITGSGTLALNWTVPPDFYRTPNSLVKRDNQGGFQATWIYVTSALGFPVEGDDTRADALGAGVYGKSGNGSGVYGQGVNGPGVTGYSGATYGVYGTSQSTGVYGIGAIGVDAESSANGGEGLNAYNSGSGDGILAGVGNSAGYAAWFNGNVEVAGTLSKSGGSFKIDHPLDPANKYLSHSFVESPDMKNIYDGVATLDASGEAVIRMPEWFGALNRDFRYQLTAIGAPGPNLYIADKLHDNTFRIAGGQPGMEVSWQITGIRQDAWANAHRIPVEEDKPEAERGYYRNPELFGAPEEKAVVWARHPQTYKHLKEQAVKANAAAALKP